jgi:hypothetical protein
MYGIVDLSAGQTMTGMAELVNRRVLRDGTQGLEFVNELVRGATYIGVPPTLRHVLHSNIADRLITRAARGAEDLGLEIAWHCMRAARTAEATEFLLSGARDSLRKGGVHAAERALSTALSHLTGDGRDQATLLLAEVLQEQGRWQESLIALTPSGSEEPSEIALILALVAEVSTTSASHEDALRKLSWLKTVIDTSSDVRARIKAAHAASLVLNDIRSVEHTKHMLRSVNQIPTAALDLDDLAFLADGKARLLYNALERGPCLSEISLVAAKLHETKHINSTVASLHTGLGVLACCAGKYCEGRSQFLRAYDMCTTLGNDTARGKKAAQIQLCCFRLGEYSETLSWGTRALVTFGPQFGGYAECQTAQFVGCSLALRGQHQKALESIGMFESRLPLDAPSWLRQAWLLAKADILFLLGETSGAIEVGLQAIGPSKPTLHSMFFAGEFARWLALTSLGTSFEDNAREEVHRMTKDLEMFDAIDQVEVLCARTLLERNGSPEKSDVTALIGRKLQDLPAAVTYQLVKLGVLDI